MLGRQARSAEDASTSDGLRERKKVKTRHAIEDAALELFAEQGFDATTVEEIAARAEVSATTFFRYFPAKADVLLSDQEAQLPALRQAIIDRSLSEPDLVAVQKALQQEWVAGIDPDRTARATRVIASSPYLLGRGHEVGFTWQIALSAALAERRGLPETDRRCWIAATMGLSIFGEAVMGWVNDGGTGTMADAVDEGFATLHEICVDLIESSPRRAGSKKRSQTPRR